MSYPDHVPAPYAAQAQACALALSALERPLLAAHVNLDGDALGSLSACGNMLKNLGKEFALYASTGIPEYLRFLTLPGPVYTTLDSLPFEPQSLIYLDCSDPGRLGPELASHLRDLPSINIDHHICDHGLGTLMNFINPTAAATSQLVAYVAMKMGQPLTAALADSITLGLMTDTGGFCHGNTTADVFGLCAILANNGCSFTDIREKLLHNWSVGRLRLWGALLCRVKFDCHRQVAICVVSIEDLRHFHCAMEDLEGLVEWLRRVREVRVAALLKDEGDICKFSLRSQGPMDVRAIAVALGGGGHLNAAGGTLRMRAPEAMRKLLDAIRQQLGSC